MTVAESPEAIWVGEWLVEPAVDSISRNGEVHKLEPRTMRLLLCLANSSGAVVSVDRLLTEVWPGVIVGSASVYQAVSQLRRLLGDVDPDPIYIATVPRKGYRLIAPVRHAQPADAIMPASTPAGVTISGPSTEIRPQATRWRRHPIILLSVVVFALIIVAAVVQRNWQAFMPSSKTVASIVVLPFIDLTPAKSDQSFCDGLTEELSGWLAQIPTLRVVARTSAFAFRGQGEDVRKIGKALDSDHILEGSMRRDGNHLRITVQLIDARNGYHLWSENFDRPIDDTIKIQEDIARSVAQTLKVRLTTDSERQFAARRTLDPDAYQLYLLARYYDQQGTPQATDRAADLYRQVVNADPKFALAYTQLARARFNQGNWRDIPIADTAAAMEPLIATALQIDPRLGAAYAVRGMLRAEQSRVKEGLEDLNLAISMDPSNMSAYASMGRIALVAAQPREALKNYDSAAALDPLNSTLQIQRCVALGDLARYEEAAQACERARILGPGTAAAPDELTWLAEARGRIDEALRWNAEALKAEPSDEFQLYGTRATLFLSLGLATSARAAVERGRSATKNEVLADSALVRVVFCEQGLDALRNYLESSHLDQSPNAMALLAAAYARLLSGESAKVKELIARALAAPDRPQFAETWYARGEDPITSYRLDRAAAEVALGDRVSADRDLGAVIAMVNQMIAAGIERAATYELRAKAYALKGQADEAMRDLVAAKKLGWRRAWWALHEPYLASLRSRSDFQTLIRTVSQSNAELAERLKADRTDI
jgi:TolB-like protein/DNA-binding winged helix-turn-helix (wHTH) protein